MSILHEVTVRQLRPAASLLKDARVFGPLSFSFLDGPNLGFQIGPAIEQFLSAVAILEVGFELGLANPLQPSDLASIEEILVQNAISEYTAIHGLALPARFQKRLTAPSLHQPDDGVHNSGLLTIDDTQHRSHIANAFSDFVRLGRAFSENPFVVTARRHSFTGYFQEVSDEVLVTALRMLADDESHSETGHAFDRPKEIALIIEALPSFDSQIIELSDVCASLSNSSAHGAAVKDLMSSHVVPDAARLAASYGRFSEWFREALQRQFATRAATTMIHLFASGTQGTEAAPDRDIRIEAEALDEVSSILASRQIDLDSLLITRIARATYNTQARLGQFVRRRDTVVSIQGGDSNAEAARLQFQRLRFMTEVVQPASISIVSQSQ
jgi:hypothetical protein